MLKLVARYGDAWNWWSGNETLEEATTWLEPFVDTPDAACEAEGRDPACLVRTLDLYTVIPGEFEAEAEKEACLSRSSSPVRTTTSPPTCSLSEISGSRRSDAMCGRRNRQRSRQCARSSKPCTPGESRGFG